MDTALRNVALISAMPVLLAIPLLTTLAAHLAPPAPTAQTWTKVELQFPASQAIFPPGKGADIANGQCLMCHSAGMVLRQPPLSQGEWASEITKMRSAYGAPIPPDQTEALASYLHAINGRPSQSGPSRVDRQGS
jgi:mono/diheme cytochrome c family protein